MIPDVALPSFEYFVSFTKLPAELRVQIWEEAVQSADPRIVEIQEGLDPNRPHKRYRQDCRYTSLTKIPALLHTCRESRPIALRRWKLSFGHANYPYWTQFSERFFHREPPKIFFDFLSDILYFGEDFPYSAAFEEVVDLSDRKLVRSVALHFDVHRKMEPAAYAYVGGLVARIYGTFPQLERLIWVNTNLDGLSIKGKSKAVVFHERDPPVDEAHVAVLVAKYTGVSWDGARLPMYVNERVIAALIVEYARRNWSCPKFEAMAVRPRSGKWLKVDEEEMDPRSRVWELDTIYIS